MKNIFREQNNKGVILFLALVIMTISLAIGLGLSALLVRQMKTSEEMKNSIIAFYAADTGIERALDEGGNEPTSNYSDTLPYYTDSSYEVEVFYGPNHPCILLPPCPIGIPYDDDCEASYFCYRSTGTYKAIKRKIEITR